MGRWHFSSWWGWLIIAAVSVMLLTTSASAQRFDGTLRGTVTDSSGAVVASAKVTARNDGTGVVSTATTSSAGVYSIPNLLVGTYTVTIEAPGFANYTRTNVQVQSAQVVEVSAALTVAGATTAVEVRAGADVVQSESSQLSATFAERTITDLPTVFGANGFGSVQNLAIFLPNTTSQLGGTSGNGGSVGGLRGRQNSFSIDGATNTDTQVSISSYEVIQDAVAEFTLSTNQFSAEYGAAAGGQYNVVTKTGTNSVHGGAWWYSSNRHLNAASNQEKDLIRSGVQNDKSRFDYNRLGGEIGGAIIPNKLFFFGAYEFQATGNQPSAPRAIMPTADGFSLLNTLAVNSTVRNLLPQFPVAPSNDLGTVPVTVNGVTTQIPVGSVLAVAPSYLNDNNYITNVDYVSGRHQVRFRHLKDRTRTPLLGTFPQAQFNSITAIDNRRVILNHVWSLNDRMVNDFKATFGRLVTDSPLTSLAATYPSIIINELDAVIGPATNLPQNRTTNWYQLADNFSWARGRHTWKFGGEYRWTTSPSDFLQSVRGQHGYQTLNSLINDLVPDFAGFTFQGIGSGSFAGNAHNVAWYVQDDIKLTPRFTLNLGLRYEFFGVPKDAAANALNAVSDCPECGLFWHKPKDDMNNFAPRVGFAWDPTGSGKWAIRGGAGMGYDHIPYNFYTNSAPPQKQAVLTPISACAGAFGTPPQWCTTRRNYLAEGGARFTFVPPTNQVTARAVTANLMSDNISPQVYSWSLSVQRELMKDTSVEIRYLGTRAPRLPVQTRLNNITIFENGAQPLPTYFSPAEIPATVAATAPTRADALNAQSLRFLDQDFSDLITAFPAVGSSRYHGGSIAFNRRMSRGLLLRANWTWSKAQDNATNDLFTSRVNPRRAQDAYNLRAEWGRSALDVGHKVAITWIYDLPKLNLESGFGRLLLNGWQWSGTYLWQGGQPVTVQSGLDSNGDFDSAGDRAILNPSGLARTGTAVSRVCRNATTGATSVDNTCPSSQTVGYVANNPNARYVQAGLGAVTNTGRNTENSEPTNIWNMGFFKNTKMNERATLQFRVDMFNVFNHRNFTLAPPSIFQVTTNALSTSYANVASPQFLDEKQFDGGSRTVQLGLKIFF